MVAPNVTPPTETELALVARLESGRAALPMLPSVAATALELANNPNADVAKFSELIETDPPMAARFMSVANSALYSRGRKVSVVHEAVMRIGLLASRDLLFQVVYASSVRGLPRFQTDVQMSFRRSVAAGILCRAAARILGVAFREAYLCGLLHDIGESRVYRLLCEVNVKVSSEEASELVARYHSRAGAELAQKWALPQDIVLACRKHHEQRPPVNVAVSLVRIADLAIPCLELHQKAEVYDVPLEQLEDLGLNEEVFARIVEQGAELVGQAAG